MLRKTNRKLSFESFEQRQMMSVTPGTITREAEDMTMVAGFKVKSDGKASGDEALTNTKKNAGELRDTLTVNIAGSYSLALTVKAKEGDSNSVFFSIDNGPKQTWNFPESGSFKTYTWKDRIDLTAGAHTIHFFGRENGTLLDKYQLKLETASTPTNPPVDPPTNPPVDPPTNPPTNPPVDPGNPPTGSLDPSKPPGTNFDLSKWKLDLPVNSSGGFSGIGMTVLPASLRNFMSSYFRTAADGAMQFAAPVIGAKTSSGTSYTRSELRELNADGSLAAWNVAQGGTMTATVAINEMPVATNGNVARVIIGQIHGPDDELCRLYIDQNGKLFYGNDKSPTSEVSHDLKSAAGAVSHIPLGAKFDYKIEVAGGKLTVSAVYNGVTYSSSETIGSFWTGKALYFKAGLYLGVGAPGSGAGTTGTGAGKDSFYALRVTHWNHDEVQELFSSDQAQAARLRLILFVGEVDTARRRALAGASGW